MKPYILGAIVAFAAAGLVLVLTSVLTMAIWRVIGPRATHSAPRSRARHLAFLRLLPAFSALAGAAVVFVAFIRLEPPDTSETVGFTLPSVAAAALAAFAWRIFSAHRAWTQNVRAVKAWNATDTLIDSDFPIVAVVGIWRPRLYVARRVADACNRDELDAMIAHEQAHVAARDNLTRFCFLCAPFAGGRIAREIERAWTRASEEAADDAARRDRRMSLALASGLTKVARLAMDRPTPLLNVSAIFSGTGVAERVRRLLETAPPAATDERRWQLHVLAAAVVMLAACTAAMPTIYDAAEYCVRYLP